ncbi:hypothetical protein OQA88_12479 [Cercophora sp. LCS_1]
MSETTVAETPMSEATTAEITIPENTTSDSIPAQEFQLFPHLPLELQRHIWSQTVTPRTVSIISSHNHYKLYSSTPVPAPLQTCREARNMSLYTRAFTELDRCTSDYIYVNFDIDTIHVEPECFEPFKPVAHRIRRMKIEVENHDEWWCRFQAQRMRIFTNIEEMFVVAADGLGYGHWITALIDHDWPCEHDKIWWIIPEWSNAVWKAVDVVKALDEQATGSCKGTGYNRYLGDEEFEEIEEWEEGSDDNV